ncbi:MAG: tetratricopeptide repeat protein [Anaerolineae bacterium]|nr:tetratricopeptide repeat protein [Gemmatimonadaceae bacterium]
MLRLKTFGGLSVSADAGPLTGAATQRKRLAVLAVLAAAGDRGVSRDRLLALFHSESDSERARHTFSQSLHSLRRDLKSDELFLGTAELRLNPEEISSDVGELTEALARGEHDRAAALYAGPFLDGVFVSGAPEFERWIDAERARLAQVISKTFETLATSSQQSGDLDASVGWWRRLATIDPVNTRSAVGLMNALASTGDRGGALQHARIHETMLREEIGVTPDKSFVSLVEQLRREPKVAATAEAVQPSVVAGTPAHSVGKSEPPVALIETANSLASLTDANAALSPPLPEFLPALPPAERLPRARWRGRTRALIAAAGVVILGMVAIVLAVRRPAAADSRARTSIAVIPFSHTSGDSVDAYFTSGITDELINSLSTIPGLRVVARTSVMALQGKNLDAREIGSRLNVDAVLEGGVQTLGDVARIRVQLVDARDGFQLWSGTYDRGTRDAFAVQEEIARAIIGALPGELALEDSVPLPRPEQNADAHDLYLRGRYLWNKRGEANYRRALSYYDSALRLDSSYSRAWSGSADAHLSLVGWSREPFREEYPRARAAAERAVRLDPALGMAHASLARVYLYGWDWKSADRAFSRAIELNPNESSSRHGYSHLLIILNRPAEAQAETDRMLEIDPFGPVISLHPCWHYYVLRRFDEAIRACQRGLELHPSQPDAHAKLANVLVGLGRYHDAASELTVEIANSPNDKMYVAQLAAVLAAAGLRDSARVLMRDVEKPETGKDRPFIDLAIANSFLGNRDRAFAHLDSAFAARMSELMYIAHEARFDSLRSDPRFPKLLAKLGLH